uniref:Uncharacterized protein n=1 Tax=Anguilla anguilla TaxID=7936 RepID=A0A0E9WR95_ANGAN
MLSGSTSDFRELNVNKYIGYIVCKIFYKKSRLYMLLYVCLCVGD